MAKDLLSGASVFILGLIVVIVVSSASSTPEQSYQMGIVAAILYLASVLYVSRRHQPK
jgi:predicted Na+-dependent transporter